VDRLRFREVYGFSVFRTDDFTCLRRHIPGDRKAVISAVFPFRFIVYGRL